MRAWPLAGKGRLVDQRDDVRFDKRYAHVEVLVIGAGASGMAAAADARAAEPDARVLVVDADPVAREGVLTDTTALGIYDHGYVTAVQRRPTARTEGRLWHIRAGRIVIATGATERPIVFADDDRPGIMLASAAATYVERYGVRPGDRAAVFTNNGTTDAVLDALRAAGTTIVAEVDARRGDRVVGTGARRDRAAGVGDHRPPRRTDRDRRGGPAPRVWRLEPERGALEPGPRHAPLRRADRGVRPGPARAARPDDRGRRGRRRHRGARRDRAALDRPAARRRSGRGRLGDPLRRPPARRDGARPAPGARRRAHLDRARQALHDHRHGRRPGQDLGRRRLGHRGGDPRPGGRRGRCSDVSAAGHPGQLRAARRTRSRRPARPDPGHAHPRLARRARRRLRGRRPVEAAALLPARRRIDGGGGPPRVRGRADRRRRHGRHDARQDRPPGAGRGRSSSTASTRTRSRRSRSGRAGTASCAGSTGWSSTTA